jgi:hypothetical protein
MQRQGHTGPEVQRLVAPVGMNWYRADVRTKRFRREKLHRTALNAHARQDG